MATTAGRQAAGVADFSDPGVAYLEDKKLKKGDDNSSTSEPSKPQLESRLEKFEAELEKYYREIRESHGFDVYANPSAFDDKDYIFNFFAFNDLEEVSPRRLKECNELAIEAVKYHNLNKKPENADLEFVKLVKFCHEDVSVRHEIYYLTLDAKDVSDGSIQTCQAKVWLDLAKKRTPFRFTPEVLMFKKKYDTDFIGQGSKKNMSVTVKHAGRVTVDFELYIDFCYGLGSKVWGLKLSTETLFEGIQHNLLKDGHFAIIN